MRKKRDFVLDKQMEGHEEECLIFQKFLKSNNFKQSSKRNLVALVFFSIHRHITAEELWGIVKEKDHSIGYTTVYRTLKLLCRSGLSKGLCFDNGLTSYEHLYNHPHHDHLICVKCDQCIEFCDPSIEKAQDHIFKKYGYQSSHHKMELYGVCPDCYL